MEAGAALGRLCQLLSLAWDRGWVVRDSVRPTEWGPIVVPQQPARDSGHQGLAAGVTSGLKTDVQIPDWFDSAWSILDQDVKIANALAGYYEGLLMLDEHPSFALVAFVGVVEAIGAKLSRLDRCEACGTMIGAGKRFRAALRLVRDETESAALAKAYGPRSKTAHEGRLYGTEAVLGTFLTPGMMSPQPQFEFVWGQVYRVKKAACDLLLQGLQGKLPVTLEVHGKADEDGVEALQP